MVNVQTVVFGLLGVSCDSQTNIMLLLLLTQWEFWQNEAVTHTTHIFDCLLRQMALRRPVTDHMCRQNHRKSLTLPSKVSQGWSCWTANCRLLFWCDISQHSSCCTWHMGLAKNHVPKPAKNKELYTSLLAYL